MHFLHCVFRVPHAHGALFRYRILIYVFTLFFIKFAVGRPNEFHSGNDYDIGYDSSSSGGTLSTTPRGIIAEIEESTNGHTIPYIFVSTDRIESYTSYEEDIPALHSLAEKKATVLVEESQPTYSTLNSYELNLSGVEKTKDYYKNTENYNNNIDIEQTTVAAENINEIDATDATDGFIPTIAENNSQKNEISESDDENLKVKTTIETTNEEQTGIAEEDKTTTTTAMTTNEKESTDSGYFENSEGDSDKILFENKAADSEDQTAENDFKEEDQKDNYVTRNDIDNNNNNSSTTTTETTTTLSLKTVAAIREMTTIAETAATINGGGENTADREVNVDIDGAADVGATTTEGGRENAANNSEDSDAVTLLSGDWNEFNGVKYTVNLPDESNTSYRSSTGMITTTTTATTIYDISATSAIPSTVVFPTTTKRPYARRGGIPNSTQRCPDGSAPEYSVYGGTYCWAHSICPRGSLCEQGQCCVHYTVTDGTAAATSAPIVRLANTINTDYSLAKRHANQFASTADLQITVYPHELTVREGKEASFECRARAADNSAYPQVRWTRVGGRLPDSAHESSGGRLTLHPTQLADSGRYACVAMHDGRTVEAYALLHIQSYGPQEFQSGGALLDGTSAGCMADEKACASNQCVKADYVCDGEPDCADRSDELNCPNKRHCEPNEFRCDNDRCIQKMWLCDADDDCGDSSDERNCGERKPGDVCQPTEFRCSDGQQCVPQSFQCDGTNDCRDGSDEIGCVQPTIVQPPDSNKMVPPGTDFKLTCRAVAVPDPYINWRLNWGPVCEPPRCQQQSEGGVGTLTIQNAQPIDQGAYTCEAINVKGRVLATPDCIVRIVNIPAPQPQPQRPMTCHPQGAVTSQADSRGQCQCKPNVAGPTCGQCSLGSFNLNERVPQGCMRCFCFGVSQQCQSSHWFRTKEKLTFHGDSQGVSLASSAGAEQVPNQSGSFDFEHYGFLTHREPHSETLYWKLPQQYLGDKVTAYGGQLSFQLEYTGSGPIKNEPIITLKGNGITLVHRPRDQEGRFVSGQPYNVQVPTYEFSFEHLSGGAATREDLLMVLADVDSFLIRATHVDDQQSTSVGEVNWETAIDRDTQDVRALEVEQCVCPPGYVGTSCEDCAPGYERSGHGPYLGTCVQRRAPPAQVCHAGGAVSAQVLQGDRCQCKQNTVGPTCDRCAPGSFNMAPQNPQGCSKCFCSGVTNQCRSSGLNRATTVLDYAQGAQDQLELSTHDARAPFTPSTQAEISGGAINFNALHEARGQSLYWKLPSQFLGDQITAYGGKLSYTSRAADSEGQRSVAEPSVIIRGNDITLHHTAHVTPVSAHEQPVDVPISEEAWQRSDGQPATREHLLMALADVSDVLVKAGAAEESDSAANAALIRVSLDRAAPAHEAPGGQRALEVEECECPVGYIGTSCEDCAPGYARTGGGLYLGLCQKCECNSHASECDAEYGACVNCQHNTEGDQCERCRPGFVGDARAGTPYDCQRAPEPEQVRPPCQCYNHSPRGCDSFGRCLLCEHNTEGYHCETCKKGYYGDATRATPYDCTPCPCPGASDCFLDRSGQVQCRNCPAGFAGRLCDECAPGYTRSQTSGGRDCEPIGRVREETIQFVPEPEVPLRVEILPPKQLNIAEGNRVKWTCKVSEQLKPDEVEVKWSKIGYAELPPNVRQHGHQLIIEAANAADAGAYRCTGTRREQVATDDAALHIAPPPQRRPPHPVAAQTQTPKPIVEPPYQQIDENQQAVFTCLTPGFADCEVEWHFNQVGGALPTGVYTRGNQIFIPTVQQHHAGNYICSVYHQFGRAESNPGRLDVNRPQVRPMVDPPEHNVDVGDPARFRCWVPGVPNAVIKWHPASSHGALPQGAEHHVGYLTFPRAELSHSGQYVCAAYDPQRDPQGSAPISSEPVRLNVRQDAEIAQPPQVDPPHQSVDLGQPARFRCWMPGQPNAQLRWTTYHNQALPPGAHEDQGHLNFASVEDAHNGAYICSVYDPNTGKSTPSAPVRLVVQKPQKPLVDPPEQTVTHGGPARIRCWLPQRGGEHLRLRWQSHGGASLPAGAHDDSRGMLTIQRTGSEHDGAYECVAHDPRQPGSEPQTSDPARIHVQHSPKQVIPSDSALTGNPPNPIATPSLLTVRRGETARFHCDARSQTPAQIHWEVREGAVQRDNELVIDGADDAHAGEYVCSATNAHGQRQAPPVRLVITDNDAPPTARVEPKIWNGKPGERHQFKCHVTGTPSPTIKWRGPGGGGNLPSDVVDLGDGVLEISNARREHEGDYTCEAMNSAGEASDFGTVSIAPSLTVRTDPAGPKIVFTVGEPVKITCEAIGDPDPDVEWLHDPGPERGDLPDDFVPITISEQFLIHPKIGLGNAGRYTCKGSNQFASVTKDIFIEVVEPSHLATVAVLGGSRQWFPPGQPAQLVCASSGASLVDRLEWTKDGSADNLPSDLGEQSKPGLLHFDTFKATDEGEYECHAYRKEEKIASTKVTISSDANLSANDINVEIAPPTVRVVNKGDSIVLDCIVHGHASEDFSYAWSLARGGSLIRQLSKEAQLVVKDAEPSNDYGIYRCEVENTDGDTVGEAQAAVAVGFDSASNPQEAKFDEDTEAMLSCPVFVVPGATVTWSKVNDDLPENHQIRGNNLVIENFDDAASGIYSCSVQYGQSSVEGFVNAKIFVPDTTIKVVLNASAESVQVGERAWLDCIVVGDANAKIEFSKEDADVLPENAQVTGNRLLFTSISEENSGKYKCRATTSEGPLETYASLNVEPAKRKRKDLVDSRSRLHSDDSFMPDSSINDESRFISTHNVEPKIHVSALTKHHRGHNSVPVYYYSHHHHGHNRTTHHPHHNHHKYHSAKKVHAPQNSNERKEMSVNHSDAELHSHHRHISSFNGELSSSDVSASSQPPMTRQHRLREQQLRRRHRMAALKRRRHRMLQQRLARQQRQKLANPEETIQIEPLKDENAYLNHHNYKVWHQKYNHYDLKASDLANDEKPKRSSIFGSWFTSS